MSHPSFVRSLTTVTLLFFCSVITHAQDTLLPVIFKSEGSQISFTVRKELLPVISHIGLHVLTPDSKTVHEQLGPANQPLAWEVKEMSRYTEGDTYLYIGAVILKPIKGDPYVLPGQIMQSGKKLEFRLMTQRPSNLPGSAPVEFHKSLAEMAPNNGAAWFFYGLAICNEHRDIFGQPALWLGPPPPPPPAPPSSSALVVIKEVPVSKEDSKRIAEEGEQWKAKQVALQKDLKVAQPFFLKATELADECHIKDAAMTYLVAIARELDNTEQERQWLFKRLESSCATNSVKAESYYALGVKQWQCAWELSGKYANKKAADLFHFRAISNPADKLRFANCVTIGVEYLEKALEADPSFVDAMYYKGLIYREKQKTTANPVERKKLGDEAMKIANRATEISKQRNK